MYGGSPTTEGEVAAASSLGEGATALAGGPVRPDPRGPLRAEEASILCMQRGWGAHAVMLSAASGRCDVQVGMIG